MQKGNISTAYRQQLVGRIIDVASKEFVHKGIKVVKMDDIARLLSVSKRTLYEIFENKEKLLMACMMHQHQRFEEEMQAFVSSGDRTVIDIVLMYYRIQMRYMHDVNPAFIYDLHQHRAVAQFNDAKREERRQHSREFCQRGIEQGLLRADVNFELIHCILTEAIDHIVLNHIYESYEPIEVFRNVIMLYVRGCCTLQGIEELEKKLY